MGDTRITPPFVSLGLKVCDYLQIHDRKSEKIVMGYCKKYPVEKIRKITALAKSYSWCESNPSAAFFKAVGQVNREEKQTS